MANFDELLKHIPAEKICHTPVFVKADLSSKGWSVTMGMAANSFSNELLLGEKPFQAFLFLIDGEAFTAAMEHIKEVPKETTKK